MCSTRKAVCTYDFDFLSDHLLLDFCIYFKRFYLYMRECDSTLYVKLVRMLLQKCTGVGCFPLGMSKASDNTRAAMKKQIR